MDLVEYHLKLVINLWCGAAPSQYTVDSQLRDIWQEQVPNLDYDTYGVPSFMKQMYQDSLFSSCTAAHNITSGELITGGGLQTFSAVYMELTPCASAPTFAKADLPFAPTFAKANLAFAAVASVSSGTNTPAATKKSVAKKKSDKKPAEKKG
ncbi:hypothetical protein [Tunturiibacter gelidoferens]|uniref:Uncharacterized protein n=1 Tax=Tunturiibacter lichenicola TaxID=2051959 RepID=A0A7Y9NLN9_9BACT|nr:hypothetical protein [Edaphobacter lichenicola]NYF51083.1 hypothetical protein [Edaphobacter lichenicola]